jgi:hypothetical protein
VELNVDWVYRIASSTTNGVFIAVGANGSILTSPDGLKWTNRTRLSTDDAFNARTIANDLRLVTPLLPKLLAQNDF